MLDKLKKLTGGWAVQIMMLLLVISFGVWGVSDVFTGFGTNAVAKVGSVEVPATEFRRRYDLAVQNLSRQFGRQFTPEEARQLNIPTQVLSRMLAEATLDDTANAMHLSLSDDTLGKLIRTDPQLLGPSGTFDRNYFAQLAQQQGLTEDDFVLERRREYVRTQLAKGLLGNVETPEPLMKALAEYRGETRNLSFVTVSAPEASAIAAPTDAELTTYFDAHKSDWKAPEYRAISYFVLSPAGIARPADVSDEDAMKRYDEQANRFVTPGTRRVEQIVFKDKEDADAAAKALAEGKTFDDLVTERGLKPGDIDLGVVTRDKISDPAVADAAFALPEGGVSAVIDGRFGPVMVRVTNVKLEVTRTFAEVKDQLKTEIATERAAAEIVDIHNSIEDARAGGDTLSEAAAKYDLKLVSVPAVDSAGKNADDTAIKDLPAGLVAAVFDSAIGLQNDPIEPSRNTFVWYEVTSVTDARDRPLEEVRDKVIAAWTDSQRAEKLDAAAEDIKNKVSGGESLETVATASDLQVNTADKVERGMPATGQLSTAAIKAAFDGPKGFVTIADGALPMTKIVLVVDDVVTPAYDPNMEGLAATGEQLSSQIINDFLAAYITQRQSETDVQINQAVIAAALGITQPTQ